MWSFHVVVLDRTAKKCTKMTKHVQSDCFRSLSPLFCGVLVGFAFLVANGRTIRKVMGVEGDFRAAGIFFRYQIPCMNFFRR